MKFFKIFALAAMMFGMVACDNGEETPEPPFKGDTGYVGTVSVVVDGAQLFRWRKSSSPSKELIFPSSLTSPGV